ncbi:MAG: aminoglycoside phosphotransferase family protein [Rhizobiaceae bacterium]
MAPDTEHPSLPAGWAISRLTPLAEGIGGRVWRAERDDGSPAIVKQPSDAARPDARRAADFLRWRDGHGAIRLLAAHGDIHLLEYAGDRRLIDHRAQHGEAAATDIAEEVVRQLHAPSPAAPPASQTPLRKHFASLFSIAESERVNGKPGEFAAYAAFADRLLDDQHAVRPLHGDIHHENILLSPRGWLAIDPKGLIGDPAYDAANMFHNPPHAPERTDPARILAMAETLSHAVERDVEALLSWAVAYSGLSAFWWLEMGNEQAALSTLEIGRAVNSALDQVRS